MESFQTGKVLPVFLLAVFLLLLPQYRAEAAMRVWFEVKPEGSGVLITPFLADSDKDVLMYELDSESQSMAGHSRIRQSGGIRVSHEHPTAITQLRMSPTQSADCEVRLRLFDNNTLIAEKILTDCRPSI